MIWIIEEESSVLSKSSKPSPYFASLFVRLFPCVLPEGSDGYEKIRSPTMLGFLLLNRLTLFIAHRLRVFRQNRIIVLYGILKIAYTFVITVLIFGLEHCGLSRFRPKASWTALTLCSSTSTTASIHLSKPARLWCCLRPRQLIFLLLPSIFLTSSSA